MIGLLTLAAYAIGLATTNEPINGLTLEQSKIEVGQTMAFVTLALSELVHVFNVRDNKNQYLKQKYLTTKTSMGNNCISSINVCNIINRTIKKHI